MSRFDLVILGKFNLVTPEFELRFSQLHTELFDTVRAAARSTHPRTCWDAASATEGLEAFITGLDGGRLGLSVAVVGHNIQSSVWLDETQRIPIDEYPAILRDFHEPRVIFYTCIHESLPPGTTVIPHVTDFYNRIQPSNASMERDRALDVLELGLKTATETWQLLCEQGPVSRRAKAVQDGKTGLIIGSFRLTKQLESEVGPLDSTKSLGVCVNTRVLFFKAPSLRMQTAATSAQGDRVRMLTEIVSRLQRHYGFDLWERIRPSTRIALGWRPDRCVFHRSPENSVCVQVFAETPEVGDEIEAFDAQFLAEDGNAPCRLCVYKKKRFFYPSIRVPEPWLSKQQMDDLLPCYREAHTWFERHSNMTGVKMGFQWSWVRYQWSAEPGIVVVVSQKGFIPLGEEEFPPNITCGGSTVPVYLEEGEVEPCSLESPNAAE
eukprot:gene31267-37784_t